MKHGRHLWACIVALILALACFVGCGGGGTEGGNGGNGGNGGGNEGGNTPATPSATPVRLELSGMKTSFEFGEAFSAGGLVVTIRYSNGTREVAKEGEYQVNSSAYNAQEAGEYEIVVHMNALSERYTVTVGAKPVDWRDDGVLRVLLIGNSYSEDIFTHMYSICESLGIEAEIGVCWYLYGLDSTYDALKSNKADYEFWLASAKSFGVATRQTGKTVREVVTDRDWDFISFHQQSALTGIPSSYTNLEPTIEMLNEIKPENAVLCWEMTWAYRELFEGETGENSGLEQYGLYRQYYNNDQMTMYNAIARTMKERIVPTGLPIVPCGTAIQNARTSVLGDTFTRDLVHLSGGAGRYFASMTYLKTLTGCDFPAKNKVPSFIDETTYSVMVEAITNAISAPFEITQSQYTE